MTKRGEKPTVLVDSRALNGSGIARYLREVLAVLLADDRFGGVALMGDPNEIGEFLGSRPAGVRTRILAVANRYYSPRMQLDWLAHSLRGHARADVAFFPHYDVPVLAPPKRSVVTIQDLTHFRVPELFAGWKRAVAAGVFDRAVGRATRVVVTSRSTARDLLARLPEAASKLDLIPLGVGAPFVGPAAPLPAEIAGLRPYLLFVGNRKPHKKLAAAIEALALLRPEWPELRLVLAGRSYPGWEVEKARAGALGVEDALVELTDVSDATLRALYAGCEALLLPSLYEGFGLPLLEAMACGAPVIGSNRASVPEVVGGAGLIADPDRPEEFADAVRLLRRDPEHRAELVRRGLARAREMSWESTALRTVDLIHETAVAPVAGAAVPAAALREPASLAPGAGE